MKKIYMIIQLLSFALISTMFGQESETTPVDLNATGANQQPAAYLPGRYVMASGGIIHATGANYVHHATVGQVAIGTMQGANNRLLSGFWLPTSGMTAVEPAHISTSLPTSFALHQNYPNPFNPQTMIQYDLPEKCHVMVEVFNVVGQRIRLLSAATQGPGTVQVYWNGVDDAGEIVSTGIYMYRLTAQKAGSDGNSMTILFQEIKKMLFVK